MAKINFTQSTVADNNVRSLPNIVTDQATTVKTAMDQYSIDDKDYTNNTLIAELEDNAVNANCGANRIGLKESGINADNVGDAVRELYVNKLDGGSSVNINGQWNFNNLPTLAVDSGAGNEVVTKDYVDTKAQKDLAETITGNWDFTGTIDFFTTPPNCSPPPVSATDLTNKFYVDGEVSGKQNVTELTTISSYNDFLGEYGSPGLTYDLINVGSLDDGESKDFIFSNFGSYSRKLLLNIGSPTYETAFYAVSRTATGIYTGIDLGLYKKYTIVRDGSSYYIIE